MPLRKQWPLTKKLGGSRVTFYKVKEQKNNSNYAKRNSEYLHEKLLKLRTQSVKDFTEALETAKIMGLLKRVCEVVGLTAEYPRRYTPINFAFSVKETSTKIRPTFNCGWSGGTSDPSFNTIVGLIHVKTFFWTRQVSTRTASLNRIWLPEGGYSTVKKGELHLEEWCLVTLTFGQAGELVLSGVIQHQAAEDFF